MKKIVSIIMLVSLFAYNVEPGVSINTPIIELKSFWKEIGANQAINCDFADCFPKNIESPIVCDARCLFTKEGYGTPEAVLDSFLGKMPPLDNVAKEGKQKPKFMIAYGPPASGKSEILRVLQKNLPHDFKNLDNTTIMVNVDNIFQKGSTGEKYKTYRDTIINKYKLNSGNYTQRLYITFRWIADQISDSILNKALAGKYNILWETTGASNWPLHEVSRINSYDYDTIVIYPVAELKQLIERAASRAKIEGQEAAPAASIERDIQKAQKNLLDLLPNNACLDSNMRVSCDTTKLPTLGTAGCRSKRVIIINNTASKGEETIAFDSKNPNKYCQSFRSLNQKAKMDKSLIKALCLLAPQCSTFE